MSSKTWGLGNQLTSRCLDAIGSLGGPRCCKRDSFTAVSVSIDFIQEHLGISLEKPERISCTFSSQNGQCIRPAMPLSCRWLPGVRKSIVKWRIFLIKMQRRSAEVLKTIYDSVVDFLFQRDLNHVIPFLIPESVYGILISAVRTDQKDAVKERRGIFADVLFVRRRLVCLRRV